MKHTSLFILALSAFTFLTACFQSPPPPKPEQFLTLADLSGSSRLKEMSPDERVINVKAKALIKRNDIRSAKTKAIELASIKAVDEMTQELLSTDVYNQNYETIHEYIGKNVNQYIEELEVYSEKKIFNGKYYGIAGSFKVNRQKVLVVLQKDLRLINTSSSTLITVITRKKGVDLSESGFTFEDVEDALMNQIQTDLNQRGLRAMDYRNAIASLQTDDTQKAALSKISKDQFLASIAGSKAEDVLLNDQLQGAESFYTTGLSLLKQLAKVVVEVNVFSVNGNVKGDVALSFNVTAKNISTGTGGAFANTVINVARRGGPNTIPAALIAGLVQDAYGEMKQEFIPQVIREMSTVSIGGDTLMAYELTFKGFDSARKLARIISSLQDDTFRYNDEIDTSVPTLISMKVRYAGKPFNLANKLIDAFEARSMDVEEPIVAPELTELVFIQKAKP